MLYLNQVYNVLTSLDMMNPRQFVIFLIKYFAEMIRFVKILFVAMPMIQSTISTHGICCKKETKHQPYNYFMFLFYLHLCDKRPCHSFQQPPLLCIMIKSRKYHQIYSVCHQYDSDVTIKNKNISQCCFLKTFNTI